MMRTDIDIWLHVRQNGAIASWLGLKSQNFGLSDISGSMFARSDHSGSPQDVPGRKPLKAGRGPDRIMQSSVAS